MTAGASLAALRNVGRAWAEAATVGQAGETRVAGAVATAVARPALSAAAQLGYAVESPVGRGLLSAVERLTVQSEEAAATAAAVDLIAVGAEMQSAADVVDANSAASSLATTGLGSTVTVAVAVAAAAAAAAAADIGSSFVGYLGPKRCAHAAECPAAESSTSFVY